MNLDNSGSIWTQRKKERKCARANLRFKLTLCQRNKQKLILSVKPRESQTSIHSFLSLSVELSSVSIHSRCSISWLDQLSVAKSTATAVSFCAALFVSHLDQCCYQWFQVCSADHFYCPIKSLRKGEIVHVFFHKSLNEYLWLFFRLKKKNLLYDFYF